MSFSRSLAGYEFWRSLTSKGAAVTFNAVLGKLRWLAMMDGRNSDWLRTMGQIGLLVSLISSFVLPPFFGGSTVVLNLFVLLSIAFVLLSVLSIRSQFLPMAPLGLIELWAVLQLMMTETPSALTFFYISSSFLFGALILSFVVQLFSQSRVDGNLLLASINIYFALGVVFAMMFGIIDYVFPGSFSISVTGALPPNSTQFMYFSLVTLSTLGYGDILPVSDQARTLAAIEALTGQVYLTIAVARLVGLHTSRS